MDKKSRYQQIIKDTIRKYARSDNPAFEEFETQIVFDDAHGHYYLVDVGWNKMKRIHGFTLHLDLRQDKIWIQQDWTEEGVAEDLIEAGVPKSDIVLAFHAPYKRPYTGFAIA
ncbi:MAG: XisI protein [Bacteroidia bacterium]